jgi:large subunit ribosomal protein L4
MSKLAVYDMKGAAVGDVDFADDLVVMDKGAQAVHDSVLATLAGQRAGTASTLRKGEVAGSNKKPWKQKGTGRARAGLRQSPVWRGGGVAFGPHPRSFALKLNRKVANLAFSRAFGEKVSSGAVRVVDGLTVDAPRTRVVVGLLKAMKLSKGALIVVDKIDRNLSLACRNIPGVAVQRASDVSVYQLLLHPAILMSRGGMEQITDRLAKAGKGAS